MAKHADEGNAANDFASMFESSLSSMEKLKPGQMVETHIVSISKDFVFLQLSGKSEGVLAIAELLDKDGKLSVKEGDALKVYFLHEKGGEKTFTTRISGDNAIPAMLENAYKNRIPVEGVVEKEIKGGFEVKLGGTRAFCPYSQMGARRVENAAEYLGKHLQFKIQEFKDNGRSILVSNRAILEDERAAKVEALKEQLQVGQVVKGTVKSLQKFGAFVDLEGIQALLPISEIARQRVEDVGSVLAVGQEIEAEIIRIDWASEKISLSMKCLLADPWDAAYDTYPKGRKLEGKVVRVADFGAFVSLESGIDGLVHVSEFKGDNKYGNRTVPVKVGESLLVQILNVDPANRRIALKPATSNEEEETTRQYMEGGDDADTYNPFASLLKK